MKPRSRKYIKSKKSIYIPGALKKWGKIIADLEKERVEKLGIKSPFDK